MKFFEGCTALITGASAGLGVEFARQLAPYAKTLVLVARRGDRLEQLREELTAIHRDVAVYTYVADLASEHQRAAMLTWLKEQGIEINFLINNAGLGDHGTFDSSHWDRVRAMLDVNIAALTHLTHSLLPLMLDNGRSAVLNVSSVASFFPIPSMTVYSATKAYVTSFSEALGIELRPKGVTVTALCPGPVKTEFFDVATRPGDESAAPHYDTMPAFVVTAQEAVRTGLEAVARDRARVIPGIFLCVAVTAAMLVPFCIVRSVLRWNASKF